MSYCADGEVEDITLVQATAPPASTDAVLAIVGVNPGDFGSLSVGSSTQMTLTLTNSGQASATTIAASGLASPFSFLGGAYPGTGGTCALTLAAGANCTLVVDFSPTATGALSGVINIDYNDGSLAQTLSYGVTGTGTAAGLATLNISEADPYDFGAIAVGGAKPHIFTITNSGGATASSMAEVSLTAPFTFSGGTYPGIGGTCGMTLTAGGSCTISVDFIPTATGFYSDNITISYSDSVSVQSVSRGVSGTGVSPALLIISDGPVFDYGSILPIILYLLGVYINYLVISLKKI